MTQVTVRQEEIEVEGRHYTVTHIPTATSGSWFIVHDACEVWGAVAIDLNGEVIGWRNPPDQEYRVAIEKPLKRLSVFLRNSRERK